MVVELISAAEHESTAGVRIYIFKRSRKVTDTERAQNVTGWCRWSQKVRCPDSAQSYRVESIFCRAIISVGSAISGSIPHIVERNLVRDSGAYFEKGRQTAF